MGPPAIAPRTSLAFVLSALVIMTAAGVCIFLLPPGCIVASAFALAASAALALTPVAIQFSYRLGVLDVPDERKEHERPMPLLGGPAVLAAFAAASVLGLWSLPNGLLSVELRTQLAGTLAAGALIALMGVADDRWGLKPGVRLIGQLAAVCLVMRCGVMMSFLPPTPLGRLGEIVLTMLWLVGITNSVNFLDGLDGLASGVSTVAALSFGVIAALTGQAAVAVVSFCLAGAALGFLKYNFRPASIYLGDSGATFLGFTLACIGVVGDWGTPDRAADLFVPVIVLGIPIYDTIYITIYRIRAGLVHNLSELAAYVGRDHLQHRLQHLGMRPARACLFICLGAVMLGVLALLLQTKGPLDRYDKFLALAVVAIMFIGATILMELGKNHRANGSRPDGSPAAEKGGDPV